jgi:hypothetical protein
LVALCIKFCKKKVVTNRKLIILIIIIVLHVLHPKAK